MYRQVLGGWMMSFWLHLALLVILGLVVFPIPPRDVTQYLVVRTRVVENPELDVTDPLSVIPPELTRHQLQDAAPLALPVTVFSAQASPLTIDVDQQELQFEIEAAEFLGQLLKQGDLAGRSEQARAMLAKQHGGSAASEAAVNMGLTWLERHQRKDGSWSFDHVHVDCGDSCTSPGSLTQGTVGATSMALLCFVGAGHTHRGGDYQEVVGRGLAFLLREYEKAETPGDLRQITSGNSGMYTQGLATIVLSELYGMTRDRQLARPAQMAVNFIVQAQHPRNGGWRYQPNTEVGDTSVVGWHVMALTSARMARLTVPSRARELSRRFLNSVQLENGAYYGYTQPQKKASTTAIGLLCRMYLGWGPDQEPLQTGVQYLSKLGPARDNMYYNYYATQVLHHWGGPDWQKWNKAMREQLISTQSKAGHAAGSWEPRDPHSRSGGRLYMTCLAILTLEVYYRHLPLYQRNSLENAGLSTSTPNGPRTASRIGGFDG